MMLREFLLEIPTKPEGQGERSEATSHGPAFGTACGLEELDPVEILILL